MIVDTMTPDEITREIIQDLGIIRETSSKRLVNEYDRERRRKKVKADLTYPKVYEIKSHKKNNWMFFFSKAPSVDRYKSTSPDINGMEITYYYSQKGLRVFKPIPTGGLSVYNGHLFKRYAERMNLEFKSPIEAVKHFFIDNGVNKVQINPRDGIEYTISVCKDGLMLGERKYGWIIHKTFITRDLLFLEQDDQEQELISILKTNIVDAIKLVGKNSRAHDYIQDVYLGITQNNK